jgi:hypothetical protein
MFRALSLLKGRNTAPSTGSGSGFLCPSRSSRNPSLSTFTAIAEAVCNRPEITLLSIDTLKYSVL